MPTPSSTPRHTQVHMYMCAHTHAGTYTQSVSRKKKTEEMVIRLMRA